MPCSKIQPYPVIWTSDRVGISPLPHISGEGQTSPLSSCARSEAVTRPASGSPELLNSWHALSSADSFLVTSWQKKPPIVAVCWQSNSVLWEEEYSPKKLRSVDMVCRVVRRNKQLCHRGPRLLRILIQKRYSNIRFSDQLPSSCELHTMVVFISVYSFVLE